MKKQYTKGKIAVFLLFLIVAGCDGNPLSKSLNEREYNLGEKAFYNGNDFILLGDYENAAIELSNSYSHFLLSGSNEMAIIAALKVHHVYSLTNNKNSAASWLEKAESISKGNNRLLHNKIVLAGGNAAALMENYADAKIHLTKFDARNANDENFFEFEYLNYIIKKELGDNYSAATKYLGDHLHSQFHHALNKQHSNPLIVSTAAFELARLNLANGEYEAAESCAKMAHDVDQIYNYVEGLAKDCLLLSDIYKKLNNPQNSDYYLLKGKECGEISGDVELIKLINKRLAK